MCLNGTAGEELGQQNRRETYPRIDGPDGPGGVVSSISTLLPHWHRRETWMATARSTRSLDIRLIDEPQFLPYAYSETLSSGMSSVRPTQHAFIKQIKRPQGHRQG